VLSATLATAIPLAFVNQSAAAAGVSDTLSAVDLFALDLAAGDRVTVGIDAHPWSGLDSVLRIFDAAGNQIALNGDFDGRDPRLTFLASTAGFYFVGVSGAGNDSYDPSLADSGTGTSTGHYGLKVSLATAPLLPAWWMLPSRLLWTVRQLATC
jgi:hypothetical protein